MTTTTYCQCLRIERTDGTILGMTTLDKTVTFGGVDYEAPIGYDDLDISTSAVLSVNNSGAEGFISGSGIDHPDLIAGKFDHAVVYAFVLDYVAGTKVRDLFRGWLGEVEFTDGMYKTELRSLSQMLQQPIGMAYQTECNRVLGDAKCGVNLTLFTDSGTITGVTSQQIVIDTGFIGTQSDDYYSYGNFTFTSGLNSGDSREVRDYDDSTGTFTFFLEFPFAISPADTFDVSAGCDKRASTCSGTFSNIENMRAYGLFVPGRDAILAGP